MKPLTKLKILKGIKALGPDHDIVKHPEWFKYIMVSAHGIVHSTSKKPVYKYAKDIGRFGGHASKMWVHKPGVVHYTLFTLKDFDDDPEQCLMEYDKAFEVGY
jgi:hypothetical protein